MPARGDLIELVVEKPASGGRMIARHEGQVVLVIGAIPGETVTARIDRVEKRVAFASAVEVGAPSPDRRGTTADLRCGGCSYAHIAYARQSLIKSEVVADAFTRIGRMALESPVMIAPSPEQGYRMRARLHVRGDRAGFYREGTHEICDAGPTGQLLPASLEAVTGLLAALRTTQTHVVSIELSESVAADQRTAHIELAPGSAAPGDLAGMAGGAGFGGVTARSGSGSIVTAGDPIICDPLARLTGQPSVSGDLQRHPSSFFQANRFLVSALVTSVIGAVPADGSVLDLYAGVGLFSIAMAAHGRERITAVEGDESAGADLRRNARPWGRAVRAIVGSVEDHLASSRQPYSAIVLDPPRTGLSPQAVESLLRHAAPRMVYVSCDPPTMARDARRLVDGGYRLESLEGFDLFPNTPHVELVGVFERG